MDSHTDDRHSLESLSWRPNRRAHAFLHRSGLEERTVCLAAWKTAQKPRISYSLVLSSLHGLITWMALSVFSCTAWTPQLCSLRRSFTELPLNGRHSICNATKLPFTEFP